LTDVLDRLGAALSDRYSLQREIGRGGQAEQAMLQLRRACRIWAETDLPVELAQTRFLLSRAYVALGNPDEGELEERTAQAAMDRIGTGALRRNE
jgi:hypothetical protein